MNENRGKILIVDDNEDVLLSLNMLLKRKVEAVRVLADPSRIGEFMDKFAPDVILLDMNFSRDAISGEEGYKWLDFILKKDPAAVVLFITAYVDTEKAVRAIKAGAVDFIPKPWDNEKLSGIVEAAVELSLTRHRPAAEEKRPTALLLGESEAMRKLKTQIERVAQTDANVLITGENGSGKDVVARLIHQLSPRSGKPFVSIDLGAIPEQLFESELFGYEKGAFTDARSTKSGRIEEADSGTLFLDEIGNLSLQMQQKMLTVIERRELSRLGSNKVRRVDVRLLAATNANLGKMVGEGRFRQDLLYRINTVELHLPPLRERGNDILLLAEHFATTISKKYGMPSPQFTPEAQKKLLGHSWQGNVRELQHVIERSLVMSGKSVLDASDIEIAAPAAPVQNETLNLEELERRAVSRAIEMSNGNLSQAADLLGISRYALYRKIEKMHL